MNQSYVPCDNTGCSGNGSMRGNNSGGSRSFTPNRSPRMNGAGMEPYGPLQASQMSPQYAPSRSPYMSMNPLAGSTMIGGPYTTLGSTMNYVPSFMPQNMDYNPLMEQNAMDPRFQIPMAPQQIDFDEDQTLQDSRFMLQQQSFDDSAMDPKAQAAKQESIMQWFDRTVEKELKKRRESPLTDKETRKKSPKSKSKKPDPTETVTERRLAEASASQVEISDQLQFEPDTALTDAVEKLAKAEVMCTFAGAVKAAEDAASNAPPELAEVAAAAGAREFQTEVTETHIRQSLGGIRPIEVVGYVGVTRPKFPKQS